jgi:two-component system, OmpR family, phosphate regulon response regulator PhoB
MPTALIVDDESDAREMLAFSLVNEGWRTLEAADGFRGFEIAKREHPDVIILDLMMPGMSGQDVFMRLRRHRETEAIPVIMLTAKGSPQEREAGLEMGADDYVTKPYSPRELSIRMERLLKRKLASGETGTLLEAGPFRLERNTLKFYLKGEPIDLTGTEFRLLMILIENLGKDQMRADLLQRIWGYDERIQTRTLDTHVKRLREKLGEFGDAIETVRGIGYRFQPG